MIMRLKPGRLYKTKIMLFGTTQEAQAQVIIIGKDSILMFVESKSIRQWHTKFTRHVFLYNEKLYSVPKQNFMPIYDTFEELF